MSVRTVDFSSTAYAKTKSFKAKENLATVSRVKEKRTTENQPSGVKSSWTPLKPDLNEKLFEERKELVSNWFDRWTDAQRKAVLEILMSKCKKSQLQYTFSLIDDKIPITHMDFTRKLPRAITLYIMSFLDPRSLCRCAQVCWFWKYLSELDNIWMPKCFKFGWILPFIPTPYEHGVWKRHYLECVRGLQYIRPKSPPGSPHLNQFDKSVVRSQSQGSLVKKTNKKVTVHEAPPWRGPDPRPNDIRRKLSTEAAVGGCRRCHMSSHIEDSEQHDHHQATKKGTLKSGKPKIRPATASLASESQFSDAKSNAQSARPDWAVQSWIKPVSVTRPSAPQPLRASTTSLGNARGTRNLPADELFHGQPWQRPLDYDSDEADKH